MKRWFSLISSIVILGLLFWVLKDINFYEVYYLIAAGNLAWFSLATLSCFLTFVVWNLRWMYIFKDVLRGDFFFMLKVIFAGAFFSTVTPGAGVSGDPFRAYFLAKKYNKPKSKIFGYVLGDKFFQLLVFAFFIVFSCLFVLFYVKISITLRIILEAILIFILVSSAIVSFFIFKKSKSNIGELFRKLHRFKFVNKHFKTPEEFVLKLNETIKNFSGVFRKVVKHKGNLFIGFFLSVIFWILNFLTAYFLFLAFGFKADFLSVIIVISLANFIGSISIIPGGIGVVETSMALLYSAMGIFFPLALLVAFLTRIIYYFFALFIGGAILISLKRESNGAEWK